jgi:hypothetical protein
VSTTTPNRTDPMNRLYRTRWFMPAFSLFLAAAIFVAYWIGDEPGTGAGGAAILVAMGALIYFGGRRSETISGLGGPGRDQRWERIDVHATALTGIVLIIAIIASWLVEVAKATTAAHTHSSAPSAGSPTSWRWPSCAGAPSST